VFWLGHPLAPLPHHPRPIFQKATDQIIAFASQLDHCPASQSYINITFLHDPDMARRGRFDVLPADNTFAIEDFDMFKIMPKATEPRRVSQNVSRP
jgi:hypothetical protein